MIFRWQTPLLALTLLFALPAYAAPLLRDFSGIETFLIDPALSDDRTTASTGVTDLSGLALCHGRLLTISDKNNDTIFEITLKNNQALIKSALIIPAVPSKESAYRAPANLLYRLDAIHIPGRQDWEGIACHGDAIYLVSERKNAILKIRSNSSTWLPVDWYSTLYEQGYLHTYNAFVEGIAVQDEHHLLVAIERQPRGILQLQLPSQQSGKHGQIITHKIDDTTALRFRNGNPDIADIAIHRGVVFTLERNASAVCRRDLNTLRADSCFSYLQVEDDPRWRYQDSNFGIGEGLALDDQWIYIVFDSNNLARVSAPDDRRSLLLRIPMPAAWREQP